MNLTLSQIAGLLGVGRDAPHAEPAAGFSIDSRTIQPGEVFFAIKAARDGHEFVAAALAKGAAAAVVDRTWDAPPAARRAVLFRVDDPAAALAELAQRVRRRWGRPLVAITGSNGKTTTKEITAALLGARYRVAKTVGNLNNELGLPLSILNAPDDAEVAVMELGMNRPGEIRRLARIAQPTIGVVTNVSGAHVGNFESVDEVASAKRELIEELGASATAVLNADDSRVKKFGVEHRGPTLLFGVSSRADLRLDAIQATSQGWRFKLSSKGRGRKSAEFETRLVGRHNLLNIAAAAAAARSFGIELEELREPIAALAPAAMRGELRHLNGVTVLDDSYNSNPAAAEAMLDALQTLPADRRIAVLGEMRELGKQSERLHRALGRRAAAAKLDLLVGVAGAAAALVKAARAAGMPAEAALYFETPEEAGAALQGRLRAGDAVLFKGSRAVGVDRALQGALRQTNAASG